MIINKNLEIINTNTEIDDETKILLLNRAAIDRRLNAKDLKLYLFLLNNSSDDKFTQEYIGEILDIARVNINRSSVKLETFGYIYKERPSKFGVINYHIETNLNIVGLGVDIVKCANLEKTASKTRLNDEDIEKLKEEYSMIDKTILQLVAFNVDDEIVKKILSDIKLRTLLFILCYEHDKLQYFKDKYLENTFKMIINNYDSEYIEEFIKVYYCCEHDTSNREYTYNDLMTILEYKNRDVQIKKEFIKMDLVVSCSEFYSQVLEMYTKATINEKSSLEYLKKILNEIEINTSKLKEEEFLVLLYLKKAFYNFKKHVRVDFMFYTKTKYLDLYESFLTYQSLLKRYKK